jgi:Tol biopolymer transport system component/tRNA A-37 threonylcarbamoyl transferase component Bud32
VTLTPGTRVGSYEIVTLIGAGGMGEVYRARDTKLNRDVAIKVLPQAFAADRERVARFEREAQTLAALNHQNIAHVHGVIDQPLGLVMELVEGDDLTNRISARGMALGDALPVARQIAEALEAAHERGVVHRDLKPANIKVREDGVVKVLDFGLAKAMDSSGAATAIADSPTFMTAATQVGTILGTAAYMSPEQARGKTVDKRADIWAFGCVLFEMLSGRRPFEGETITEILGAIIHTAPDFSLLPVSTPPPVVALVARCLEKDVTRRLRDIGEARVALETSQASQLSQAIPIHAPARPSVFRRAAVPAAIVAALAAGVMLGAIAWPRRDAPLAPIHVSIGLPEGFRMSQAPAISPDGTTIAYVGGTDRDAAPSLYLRSLDSFEARAVSGSTNAGEPFFSPDGRDVAFFSVDRLARVRVSDGSVTTIQRITGLTGGSWGDDGHIIFSTGVGSPLHRVRADGGPVEALTAMRDEHYAHVWPQHLPGGVVAFRPWSGQQNQSTHCRLTLSDAQWSCFESQPNLRFLPSGHVLTDGSQRGIGAYAPGDDSRFKQAPQPVVPTVYWRVGSERSYYAVSATGTLVYVPGDPLRQRLIWIEPDGTERVVLDENSTYSGASLSPDGKRLAFGGAAAIWVVDLERGTRVRVSGGGNNNVRPLWSADGRRVVFSSNRARKWSVFSASSDDGWAETELLKREYSGQLTSLAEDGSLVVTETHPSTGSDIWMQRADGTAVPVVVTPYQETSGRVSPGARLIAYTSNPNGRTEVFVKPLSGGEIIQVSTDGGDRPFWSRKGDWLYFSHRTGIMRVAVDAGGRPGLPQPMVHRTDVLGVMDTSLDGRSLLTVKQLPDSYPSELRLITNFVDLLRSNVK